MTAVMKTLIRFFLFFMLMMPSGALLAEKGLTIKNIRYFSYPAFTRIVFELDSAAPYVLSKTTDGKGLMFAAYNMPLVVQAQLPVIKDGIVGGLEINQDAGRSYLFVRLDTAAGEVKDFVLHSPDRIVLDIGRATATIPVQEDKLITVVLDAGHGGRDAGIVSTQGTEKNYTLDVALAVKRMLHKNQRLKVILTREKDQMLSLDDRAAISNTSGASIFVSIHGHIGTDTVVYMQDLSDDIPAHVVRPGSVDFLGFESGRELQQMLWGRQQAKYLRESGEFGKILAGRFVGRDSADPVQAPLAGLKAIDAAAALVECGMTRDISKVAEAIAGGIERYVRQNR